MKVNRDGVGGYAEVHIMVRFSLSLCFFIIFFSYKFGREDGLQNGV